MIEHQSVRTRCVLWRGILASMLLSPMAFTRVASAQEDSAPEDSPPPPPANASFPAIGQAEAPTDAVTTPAETMTAPAEPSATTTSPIGCEPACRAGYTCLSRACVSRCNPPCGEGEVCTDSGACVAQPVPLSAAEAEELQKREQRRNGRLGTRFGVAGQMGGLIMPSTGPGVSDLGFGLGGEVRHHPSPGFAIQGGLHLFGGFVSLLDDESEYETDTTATPDLGGFWTVTGTLSFAFGGGRFFAGPELFLGYINFGKDGEAIAMDSVTGSGGTVTTEFVMPDDTGFIGSGGWLGIRLGPRERVELGASLGGGLTFGDQEPFIRSSILVRYFPGR